jgi:hypothetical protein
VERVLDPRVYRLAFVPALLAVFVVAFSLEARPRPATTLLSADAFDGVRAYGGVRSPNSLMELAAAFPDRRPGSVGDAALADRVAATLRRDGFRVTRRGDDGRTVDGERPLETVEGVRPGRSDRRIVVLSHRDSLASPGLAELSATASFLELARIFRSRDTTERALPGERRLIGRELRKTLVLVSTSGGSGGDAGARAWARSQDASLVDGVLVLGDVAAAEPTTPWVVPWSNGGFRPPFGWRRTVEAAVRTEVGVAPGGFRATAQWARRALPFTVSEQGEVDRAGLPAVLLQASGERGPAPDEETSRDRFDAFGRAALRAITALDGSGRADASGDTEPAFAGETSGIVTLRNLLPDWSVRLLVLCFLLPALLAALDAVFRARRRRLAVGAWLTWILWAALPPVAVWVWLRVLGLTGALPAPPSPLLPSTLTLTGAQAAALASTALAVVLAVVAARAATRPSSPLRHGVAADVGRARGRAAVASVAANGVVQTSAGVGDAPGRSVGGADAASSDAEDRVAPDARGRAAGTDRSAGARGRAVIGSGAGDGAAAAATGAVVGALALAVWVANPYAAALLVPAAHLWLLAGMPASRLRGLGAWLAVAAGLALPLLVVAYQMTALQLDLAGWARMALIATAGGHVSPWTAVAAGLMASALVVAARAVIGRRRIAAAAPPPKPMTRGPATYYGPGSLGGTESALRR